MPQLLQNTRLMNRFFEQRAQSAIAATPFFGFGQIAWGTGFTETVDGLPSVLAVLPDSAVIAGEFARTNATYTYNATTKEITVQASIPKGSLPAGTNVQWTTCYVLDRLGEVIALAVGLPTPVTSTVGVAIEFVLDTGRPVI